MKPILVDNCEHYSGQTHSCTKCGRGLPDVCLDFENMKNAAKAYEAQQNSPRHNGTPRPSDDGDDDTVAAVDTSVVPKRRGRPAKVTA